MAKPLFQHRHYVEIARIITTLPHEQRAAIAVLFSKELKGSNPLFDTERFTMAAIGQPQSNRDAAKGGH